MSDVMPVITGRLRRFLARLWLWLRESGLSTPLFIFLITRILLFAVAYLGRVAFLETIGAGPYHAAPGNLFLDIWDRWDSSYYRSIADLGYVYSESDPGNVAFFPGYPLLVAAVWPLVNHPTAAGIIVSNFCFLGALILLYRLSLFEFDDEGAARRTLYYVALFPTSFFFSALYSESTFLLLSVATVYFIRRRHWLAGSLTGMAAAATRSAGILLYVFALFEWLTVLLQHYRAVGDVRGARGAAGHLGKLLSIHLIPLGLGTFMLHLWHRFGDPLLFVKVQKHWGRSGFVFPLSPLWRDFTALFRQDFLGGDTYMWRVSLDALAGVAALLLIYWIWRHLGLSYAAYTLLAVLFPLASGNTMSMLRYVAVLFPGFMILALWGRREAVDRAITIGFTLLLALLTVVFVNWGFVA